MKPDSVVKLIREFKPTHIINTSAFTAVDLAESERDSAMQINAHTVGIIGEIAKHQDAAVIHYSTDYVFDGEAKTPYLENHPIKPVNYYGETKAMGEKHLKDTGCHAYVFRCSWIYGKFGHNFLKTILKFSQERPELKIISDQLGSPTASFEIAEATLKVLADKQLRDKAGIYHIAPEGDTSWFGFAEAIVDMAKFEKQKFTVITESIVPIKSEQFVSAAKRPKYSVLDSGKLKKTFAVSLPHWDYSLKKVMSSL